MPIFPGYIIQALRGAALQELRSVALTTAEKDFQLISEGLQNIRRLFVRDDRNVNAIQAGGVKKEIRHAKRGNTRLAQLENHVTPGAIAQIAALDGVELKRYNLSLLALDIQQRFNQRRLEARIAQKELG